MNVNDARAILIVDDHEIVREGVRSLLTTQRPQWTVSEAASGAEAVELIRKKAPDLVIMDVSMPYASGFDTISLLREAGFSLPILVFTMHHSRLLGRDVKEAGAQGYVLKSQATDDLVRAIDSLLSGGTFFGETPGPDAPPKGPTLGLIMFFRDFALNFA